jgi:pyruvate dehydrogenase E2 component (dihydrolipoamide acetyltransferase)
MSVTVTMPALSPTMTEGTLAKWLVKEGDKVAAGDVIAEIETDKATMEFEAVDEGVIGKLLVPAGAEKVAVNTPIAIILVEGNGKDAGPAKAPAQSVAPAPAIALPAAPILRAMPSAAPGQRQFASPLARRLAAAAGIAVSSIRGSGPHGRVVKADVDAAKATPTMRAPAAVLPAAPVAPATPAVLGEYVEVPLNTIRKVSARRLLEAKQTIPHFYLTIHCQLDELAALRVKLNARGDGQKISVNDFVIRAMALALVRVPEVNASWAGDKIVRYKNIDVSVAVAIDDGLITPIVRNADRKSVTAIAAEMKDLAARAKAGKLRPEEFQGGGITVSNLGMFGISEFSAVINPPQASILAVGAGEQRPIVKDGALAVATMMTCTLSCDHRVVDGVLGAKYLAAFKGLIEDPLTLML